MVLSYERKLRRHKEYKKQICDGKGRIMEKHKHERSTFSGKIGFVLSAAGASVGLGNIWRFPYLAAKYGGGIFLLIYIILALTFGYTLLTTEIAIGRKTKQSPLTAYTKLHDKWGFLGAIASIIPVIIMPYYCTIGGWVVKYFFVFLTGHGADAAQDGFFTGFITSQWEPIITFVIFLAVSAFIVFRGVNKGIESTSKIIMPILLVMILGIAIFSLTLKNTNDAGEVVTGLQGFKIYIVPNFEGLTIGKLFTVLIDALGQLFFSLSVAMGIMITYGSYVKDDANLGKSINQIEIFDTVVALLAGFMVVPAVYVFSGEAGTKASGAGLMFVTLPKVFEQMRGGTIIGILFFVLVFLGALTSSISIMEAIVSSFMDRFGISRKKSVAVCIIISIIMGIPSSLGNGAWAHIKILGMDFLTFFDYISNSVLMPIVALCTCILIGWAAGAKTVTDEVKRNGEKMNREKLYNVMIKYIAPVMLVIILITYSMAQFGFFTM